MIRLALVVVLTVQAACGGGAAVVREDRPAAVPPPAGAAKPKWVDSPYAAFEQQRWLAAVGQGSTRDTAESAARTKLAAEIRASIDATLETLERETSINSELVSQVDVKAQSRLKVEATLNGVQIRECWTDPAAQVSCVALLERAKAWAEFESQIKELDGEITALVGQAAQAGDTLGRVKVLAQALDKLKERGIANAQARAVAKAVPLPEGVEPGRLRGDLAAALTQLRVFVYVDDGGEDPERRILYGITESLTKAKITVVEVEDGADVTVRGEVRGKAVNETSASGFKFAEYSVSVQLVNPRTNDVVGAITQKRKEGANDAADAKNRALNRLRKEVTAEFALKFRAFIFGAR